MDDGVNLFADQAAQYEILSGAGYSPQEAAMMGGWQYTSADLPEAQAMNAIVPAPAGSEAMAPWERAIRFGLPRGLDSVTSLVQSVNNATQGNTSAGSYAGQNGRTYQPTPTQGSVRQPSAQGGQQQQQSMSPTLLIAAAAVAYLALA